MCDQVIVLNYSRWLTSESWNKAMGGWLDFALGVYLGMVLTEISKLREILRGLFVHMAWENLLI